MKSLSIGIPLAVFTMFRWVVLLLCGVVAVGSKSAVEELHGQALGYVDARVSYTTEVGVFPTSGDFTLIIDYGGQQERIESTIAAIDTENRFEIRDKNGAPRGSGQCHTSDDVDDIFRLEIESDYYIESYYRSDPRLLRICKLRFTDELSHTIELTKVFSGDDLLLISGSITAYARNFMLKWESLTEKGENSIRHCWEDRNDPHYSPCDE